MLPAKADPGQQKEFLEKEIQPRLDEAREGSRQVLFMDAAHFVLAPFLGFLWSVAPYLFERHPVVNVSMSWAHSMQLRMKWLRLPMTLTLLLKVCANYWKRLQLFM